MQATRPLRQQKPVVPEQHIIHQETPRATKTTYQKVSPAEQLAYSRQVLEPIRSTVRGRISFYVQKMNSWQRLEHKTPLNRSPEQGRKLISCRNKVADLHEAYNKLQIKLFNNQTVAADREQTIVSLQNLQKKDFSYLEGECPALFKELNKPPERTAHIFRKTVPIQNTSTGNNITINQQPAIDFLHTPQTGIRYNQAIRSYESNLISTGKQADYEKRYQYALALLKSGREQEARRVFSDLLTNVRRPGNRLLQVKVLQKFAELEFALRNYIPAQKLYKELLQLNGAFKRQYLAALQTVGSHKEEVDAYASLLLGYLTSKPEQDGFTVVQQAHAFIQNFPVSSLKSSASELAGKVEKNAAQWFHNLLRQADNLSAARKNQEALELLEQVPLDILPLDKQDILQKKKNALRVPPPITQTQDHLQPTFNIRVPSETPVLQKDVQITPVPRERTMPPKQDEPTQRIQVSPDVVRKKKKTPSKGHPPVAALQKTWDKGMDALQATEYDTAIGIFSDLLNTSLATKARNKIKEASRSAGQDARREAANFFQRANSATDPETKKQHLLSSKALLEDILQKYPLADLEAKVKRNISRVDKELTAIEHTPFE
ncbi:MAG: hypothetical protein D3924_03145 [Candidatus Electrothrix sp. AR4]|nr:hypothetical protein [Candidatus Electrothrix sp. AR4]